MPSFKTMTFLECCCCLWLMFQTGRMERRVSQLIFIPCWQLSNARRDAPQFKWTTTFFFVRQRSSRDKVVHFFRMSCFGRLRLRPPHFVWKLALSNPAAIWDEFILENRMEEREKGKSVPMEWGGGGGSESWEPLAALHCEIHSNSSTCWRAERPSGERRWFVRGQIPGRAATRFHAGGAALTAGGPQSKTASFVQQPCLGNPLILQQFLFPEAKGPPLENVKYLISKTSSFYSLSAVFLFFFFPFLFYKNVFYFFFIHMISLLLHCIVAVIMTISPMWDE